MSLNFEDRVPKYPNRYLMTTEDGTSYYVTLQRADEPTTVGTPLNAGTLNQLATAAEVENLPNMYLWKRYVGDPDLHTEKDITNCDVSSKLSGVSGLSFSDVVYGDSYTCAAGTITLVNQKTNTPSMASALQTTIRGKYVRGTVRDGGIIRIYYIPEDATITQVQVTSGYLTYYHLRVDKAVQIEANYLTGYIMGGTRSTYPYEGTNEDDGYWYIYQHKFGDCNGNVTDAQIAEAVATYLEQHPAGGVTMNQVDNAIDSAIGDAIGGSY